MTRPALFEQPWPDGDFRFFQLGFLVDDIVEAASQWARVHGVGPFHIMPVVDQTTEHEGVTSTISIRVGVAQAGPVQIELVQQMCDRPSIYRDWRRGRLSGLHQLCSVTPDYDAKIAHYRSVGYEPAAESNNRRFRVAYIDTSADFGFYTEVVEETPRFLTQVAGIARTCAEWDGTDPVRLLTRDGYQVPG